MTRVSPDIRDRDGSHLNAALYNQGVPGLFAPIKEIGWSFYFYNPELITDDIIENGIVFTDQDAAREFQRKVDGDRRWKVTEETWEKCYWPPYRFLFSNGKTRDGVWTQTMTATVVSTDVQKPSWEQITRALRAQRLDWHDESLRPFPEYALDATDAALTAAIKHEETKVHIDDGSDMRHMPALIHLLSRTASAGNNHEVSVLKDQDGDVVELWTESKLAPLLDSLADRTNLIMSAQIPIRAHLLRLNEIAVSEDGGLGPDATYEEKIDARWDAYVKANDYAQADNLDAEIDKEIARISALELPADLSTAKDVLISRLESVATGRQKNLKSAMTQQAIDNWASCIDQDKALNSIARHCTLGRLAIGKVDDDIWKKVNGVWEESSFADFIMSLSVGDRVPDADVQNEGEGEPDASLGTDGEFYRDTASGLVEAKNTYARFRREIRSVTVANTPHWVVNGEAVNDANTAMGLAQTRTITVRAVQPAGAEISGDVDITKVPVVTYVSSGAPAPAMRTLRRPSDPLQHEALIVLPTTVTGAVGIVVEASNLCGPSRIEIYVAS